LESRKRRAHNLDYSRRGSGTSLACLGGEVGHLTNDRKPSENMKLMSHKTRLLAAKIVGAVRVLLDVMLHDMADLTSCTNRRVKFQNDAG
jgi:hypothetical protein